MENEEKDYSEYKQAFLSFLLGLQNATFKDYSLLTIHEKKAEVFLLLFHEWLMGSKLFSKKELEYCPFFRTPDFMRTLRIAEVHPTFTRSLFQFLIAYKISR